jgi:Drexlerviridae HNH endonuclease
MNQSTIREWWGYKDGALYWRHPSSIAKVGSLAGSRHRRRYDSRWEIKFKYKTHSRARLVWIWHFGDISDDLQVDHINRNSEDDRIENLRLVSPRENSQNKKNHSRHGIGVRLYNGKYRAQIKIGAKQLHLGTFLTEKEASAAYWKAVKDRK